MSPIRKSVTDALRLRTEAAMAAGGPLDLAPTFPEVSEDGTLSETIAGARRALLGVFGLFVLGGTTPEAVERAVDNMLTFTAATGYAVGVDTYDERAAELARDMFPGE